MLWRRGRTIEKIGYTVGALLLASGLIHLAMLAIGGGPWDGPVSLRKAATFGLSFGVTLLTIVWVASFLKIGDRWRRVILGEFAAACVLETVLVSLQAWRGVPSHFNIETAFDAQLARILAAGGGLLIATIVALLIIAFRRDQTAPRSMLLAIRTGFVLLFISLMVGASMIVKGMRLVFAGTPQLAYATGGALKPTHAVTMHAILVLPMLAWLLSRVDWPEPRRVRVVLLAATAYVALAAAVAIANLLGMPA